MAAEVAESGRPNSCWNDDEVVEDEGCDNEAEEACCGIIPPPAGC